MKRLGLLGLAFAVPLQAAPVEIDTVVGNPVSIIEITDIREVSQKVDKKMPGDSELRLEITGIYEGHGPRGTVAARFKRLDDRRPTNYASYEIELFEVYKPKGGVSPSDGAIPAGSHPQEFKIQVALSPKLWIGTDFEWDLSIRYRSHMPVFHEVYRGYHVMLRDVGKGLQWLTRKIGFTP